MISGRAIFESGTHVCFYGNIGIKGAAIALYGFSSFVASNGSLFEFINNTAVVVGGGMYYTILMSKETTLKAETAFCNMMGLSCL